jgi:hypothetical protein
MAKALELIMIAAHAILIIYCLSHLDWVVVENAMAVAFRSRDGLVIRHLLSKLYKYGTNNRGGFFPVWCQTVKVDNIYYER